MAVRIRPASLPVAPSSFGLLSGYVFAINTVVGAGFLSLPWAYAQGGWALSLGLQSVCMAVGWLLSLLQLEVLSRVEALYRLREAGHYIQRPGLRQLLGRKDYYAGEPLLLSSLEPEITHRRFDLIEVVRLLLGRQFSVVYIIALCLYTTGALTAYSSIFSASFASNVPLGAAGTCDIYADPEFAGECRWKYWVYLSVYAVFMVYFTLAGLREQLWMQYIMTTMRFAVMIIVISTCAYSVVTHSSLSSEEYNSAQLPAAAQPRAFGRALPIILFAVLYQVQLPSLIEHLRDKRRNAPRVAAMTAATSYLFYALLGLLVPTAISSVPGQSTLSYRHYSAGHASSQRPAWTYIIEYLVVIFPALDVFSSFPLNAIPLSDNLMTLVYGSVPKTAIPLKSYYLLKLIACLPALGVAALEFNLGEVLEWTGLLGFFLVLFTIPLCQIAGRKMLPVSSQYDVTWWPMWLSWLLSLLQVPIVVTIVVLNLTR